MPTYGYRCERNGHEFEVFQGMADPPLKRCQVCGSKVRRIFYPVGIVFKGPGFYKTDSRGGSSSTVAAADKPDTTADTASDSGKEATVTKAESKPAKSAKSSAKSEKKST